jgi:hypothetical protein
MQGLDKKRENNPMHSENGPRLAALVLRCIRGLKTINRVVA